MCMLILRDYGNCCLKVMILKSFIIITNFNNYHLSYIRNIAKKS